MVELHERALQRVRGQGPPEPLMDPGHHLLIGQAGEALDDLLPGDAQARVRSAGGAAAITAVAISRTTPAEIPPWRTRTLALQTMFKPV